MAMLRTIMGLGGLLLGLGIALLLRGVEAPPLRTAPALTAAPVPLRAGAPAPVPAAALAPAAPSIHQVEASVRALRGAGATDDAVYRARAAALDARTIATLTEREQAEVAWARRIGQYQQARGQLEAGDEAALQALRRAHFGDDELARLAAYESTPAPQLLNP